MAKQKKVTVNGTEYTLQSVSPTWYYDTNDECGNTVGNIRFNVSPAVCNRNKRTCRTVSVHTKRNAVSIVFKSDTDK